MRPLKLTLSGFITYQGTEVIDFERFRDAGIFIITGPTGSGKTTIFDGICYALYGELSGSYRQANEDVRCQYLGEQDPPTYAELEFLSGGEYYRIKRIPTQRAMGVHRVKSYLSEAELYYRHDGKERVLTKIKEINEKMQEIIGLSADQFKQIILLPQGEFREFLSSDSSNKLQILRKIFDTKPYRALEELLQKKADLASKELETIRSKINNNLTLLSEESVAKWSDILTEDRLEPELYAAFSERLHEELVQKKAALDRGQKEIDRKREEQPARYSEMQAQKKLIEELDALADLTRRHAALEEQKQERMQLEKNIALAERAVLLRPLDELTASLKEKLRQGNASLEQKERERIGVETRLSQWQKKYDTKEQKEKERDVLRKEKDSLEKELSRLQEMRTEETTKRTAEQMLETLRVRIDELKKQEERIRFASEQLGDPEEQREQLEVPKDKAEQEKAELTKQVESLRTYYANLAGQKKAQEDAAKELAELAESLRALEMRQKQAEQVHSELERRYDEQGLYRYSEQLRDGAPCPLCGSLDHPNRIPAKKLLSKEELIASKTALDQMNSAYNKALGAWEDKRSAIASKRHIKPFLEAEPEIIKVLAELRIVFKETDEELLAAVAAKGSEIRALENQVKETIQSQKAQLEEIKKLQKEELKLRKDNEETQKELQEKRIEEARQVTIAKAAQERWNALRSQRIFTEDAGVLQKKKVETEQKLTEETEAWERIETEYHKAEKDSAVWKESILSLQKNQLENQSELQEAEKNFAGRRAEHFVNEEAYRSVALQADRTIAKKDDVAEYFKQLARLETLLEQKRKELSGQQPKDVDALQEAYDQAQNEILELDRSNAQLRQKLHNEQTLEALLHKETGGYQSVLEEQGRLQFLDSLARGTKATIRDRSVPKISFETFGLLYFFDEVLDQANLRLQRMTGGQYELYRKEDDFKAQAKQGLDIEVLDTNVGKKRSSTTLSGGESFLASLALALGMSDVIMSYSGQVEIDTLFIDEGFGTLDSDMLQSALDILMDLSDGNRLIGIISHVEELKTTIQNKLLVHYEKDKGSHITIETL